MEQERRHLEVTAWSDLVTIVCFLLVLVVPGVTTLVSRHQVKPEIKKEVPIENVADYYTRFKERFEQSFGFRTALVHLNARKGEWLGVPTSHKVLYGKDQWLFYSYEGEIPCSRHGPLDKEQLRQWAAVLEARRLLLERKGIHYLFLVAPCKHTIYPEYLPTVMAPVTPQSRLDQLIDYVGQHDEMRVLDVRTALIAAKPLSRLYYLTDTHWNTRGAFIAYQQIMGRVQAWYPKVQPHVLSDYSLEDSEFSGDLASLSGLQSNLTEREERLTPRFKSSTRFITNAGKAIDSPHIVIDLLRSESPDASIPKLVMFRDSFTTALIPYVAEHFRSAAYFWNTFDTVEIEKEKPDVVIEEIAERYIMLDPPRMP